MANNVTLPDNPKLASQMLDNQGKLDLIKAKHGWLGKIWGSADSVPNNIAAMVLIVMLVTGGLYSLIVLFLPDQTKALPIKDFWGIITPIITLTLGFIFGKKVGETRE